MNPTDAAGVIALIGAISPVSNPATTEPGTAVGVTSDYFTPAWRYLTVAPTSTAFSAQNVLTCFRFHLSQRITVVSLVYNLAQSGQAGKKIFIGIYSADGSTLLINSGPIAADAAAAVKVITTGSNLPVTLARGMYIQACGTDDNQFNALVTQIPDSVGYTPILNGSVVHKGTAANPIAAAALPSSLGALTTTTRPIMLVVLQD
jgi:hypothetical protein